MSTDPKITQDKPRLSTLDALPLAPLAAPFLLPPLGLLGWGAYRLGAGYVAALQAPPGLSAYVVPPALIGTPALPDLPSPGAEPARRHQLPLHAP